MKRVWRILPALALLMIAVVTLMYGAYHRDMVSARARVASGSQIADTPCGPIEYAVSGGGRPALMIHGAGGGFDQGLDFSRPLATHGLKVVAPSRFGYLRTPMPADASPMAQADAHACLLDALGIQKAVVLGGSAGAPSAVQLCLRHPERCSALVLVVPIMYSEPKPGTPVQRPSHLAQFMIDNTLRSDFIFWSISHLAPETTIKSVLATPPEDIKTAGPEEQARVAQIVRNIEPISLREKGLRNDSAIAQTIGRYELEKLSVPTLIISVEDDLFGTYERGSYTAAHISGAMFVGYPKGGHLWVGHQTDLWQEVATFLESTKTSPVFGN